MERNVTLDFIRGVAILGILLLNINAFGLPKAAYLNPAWYGNITLSDAWSWAVLDLFAQVKFLTLFALLFGAGLQMLLPARQTLDPVTAYAAGAVGVYSRFTLLGRRYPVGVWLNWSDLLAVDSRCPFGKKPV